MENNDETRIELDEIQQEKLKEGNEETVQSPDKRKKKKKSISRDSSLEAGESTDDMDEGKKERRRKKSGSRSGSRSNSRRNSVENLKKEDTPVTPTTPADSNQNMGDALNDFLENETSEITKLEKEQMKRKEEEVAKEKLNEKKKKGGDEKKVSYFQLFKFADWRDYALMLVGCICAIGHGVLMPLFAIFFGDIIDAFGDPTKTIQDTINPIVIDFVILAAAAAISSYLQVSCLMLSGNRQANRIRKVYFKSVLSQEIGWYDCNETGELTSHIGGDVMLIQEAISEKLGTFFQMITMFITGFVVGFINGWRLALVILSVVPVLAICGAVVGVMISNFTNRGSKAYAKAGGVAEEVISCIRTVAAFGGEDLEKKRYGKELEEALSGGVKKGHATGIGIGVTMFVIFCSYSLAFYYGSILIEKNIMTAGSIMTVFFSVLIGAMSIGQASPSVSSFASGSGAAAKIYEVIYRKPLINPFSEEGETPSSVEGRIEFKDIHFTYPNRPQQKILNGLSFSIEPGKTVALVGQSGCGKSTTISLIERFYDPNEGVVTLDGRDLKSLSLKWLRKQVGIVSQEPVLFAKSIKENISFGRDGVTEKEIIQAAKDANIHDFISKLPQGYDTLVGERGTQLSGGQKQRIAIARALVRNPKILLLDEATSALDNKSEKIVQDALDKASKGRTTIVIAHRLSTVRNADKICVVDKGVIVESGTHEELMAKKKSIYQDLVKLQEIAGKEEGNESKKEDTIENADQLLVPSSTNVREASVTASFSRTSNKIESSPGESKEKEAPIPPQYSDSRIFWRSIKLNFPEIGYMIVGLIACICNGAVFPVFSLVFAEVLADLLTPPDPNDPDAKNRRINFWCIMFIVIAAGTGIANYFQNAMFAISGERLTNRVRQMFFGSMIRQEVAFFDDTQHSTGILATKLSNDATLVKGITGERIGLTLQLLSTIIIGLIIALTACWELALVVLGCVPLVGIGAAGQLKVMTGFNLKARKAYEGSGGVASEAISNIRTVAGLGLEQKFIQFFDESLIEPESQGKRTSHVAGLGFAFGEAMLFLIWALAFYFGGWLVGHGRCDFGGMMKAVSSIVFSAAMMGQLSSLMPDVSKATVAARGIFEIVDSVPMIDSSSNEGTKLDTVRGEIEFRNVKFFYPTRPNVKVLKSLSFKIKPGQTLALVGQSGCGKSTSVSIIERFYDIEDGQILLDGVDMRSMNVKWLRRQIGIVGQEPVLFATSIQENIAYGKDGQASLEEVMEAAKQANAHKFISALASGYQTDVGEKGSQLSGGQKQRVAIARALIRDPKILLLDEATSALDSESEKIVQHALDKARKGRTTIVIAHRLSTIQNADIIAVVDNGVVVEHGSHFELLEKKGHYYRLVNNKAHPV